MKSSILSFTLLLLMLSQSAFAWSGAGHMAIAAIAYNELSPEQKKKVTDILKSHPDFDKWQAARQKDGTDMEIGAYIFEKASTWPDEIRRKHNQYDHPHWHYIDYPLRPPSFPFQPAPTPDDDVLYGIAQSEKSLSNPSTTAEEKAVYLSWLIHLVGDIHQPLHCASLFTSEFPNGDKGGNDFQIQPGTKPIKLHSYWDGLLGTRSYVQGQHNYALKIVREHPRTSLKQLKETSPKDWSLEGRSLAINWAYLNGRLKNGSAVGSDYNQNAKAVAEQQAALAGYRLADGVRKVAR